jgi:hypothetical protein
MSLFQYDCLLVLFCHLILAINYQLFPLCTFHIFILVLTLLFAYCNVLSWRRY